MSFLFLFASIGVINGLIVGSYLVFKKSRTLQEVLFGGLMLSLCIRIGKSVIYYFDRDADKLFLQIGLSVCILIGPLFYLYFRSLYNKQTKLQSKDMVFLLILVCSIVGIGFIYPYRSYPEIWNGYIIYYIYSIWMAFVLLGVIISIRIVKKGGFSLQKFDDKKSYVLVISLAVTFITITYALALFGGITYIWGSLIFSLSFYYLIFRLLTKRKSIIPKVSNVEIYDGKTLLDQLNKIMAEEKPFTKQRFKLEDLAKLSGHSRNTVSKILNETYAYGFTHYLKEYRVSEAKLLIKNRPELSLEGIGYESGFSSKSSFFDAFKKLTQVTPSTYKKSLEAESPTKKS